MLATEEERNKILRICGRLGIRLTDEQMDFAADFTKPLISFSNPGTGKSTTTVVGLIMAEVHHGVPGRQINAMSFTNAATAELKSRYSNACELCSMTPTVKFNTFHSICYSICRDAFPRMRATEGIDWGTDIKAMMKYLEQAGITGKDEYYAKKVVETIGDLNSSMIYDELNIERSYKFKQLGLSVKVFQDIRVEWLLRCVQREKIPQGEIPVMALYVLCLYPEIRAKYRAQYDIMVVDEFQDMSNLYLKVLSMIAGNLIAIGDMKQQIYGFNGASLEIVREYKKIYPNAREVNLTQSFRCKEEIARYATNIIRKNDPTVAAFKGVSEGGCVEIMNYRELNVPAIVMRIKEEQKLIGNKGYKDSMFLFRNNVSAIPLAEELYRQHVSFRMPKFLPVYEMPVFKTICTMIDAAIDPRNLDKVSALCKLIPEFKKLPERDNVLLCEMRATYKGMFDVAVRFREQRTVQIMNALQRAAKLVSEKAKASQVFNAVFSVYEHYILEDKWWLFPKPKEYYIGLVAPIVTAKTYDQMLREEYDKQRFISECERAHYGVRCYTLHAAKGLEADNIYILDADEGVFPNVTMMKKYIDSGCEYEAAKELHNERNLLYVGITRAKDNVTICYGDELTSLIEKPLSNGWCYLDTVYENTRKDYDDVGAFIRMFRLEAGSDIESDKATASDIESELIDFEDAAYLSSL